MTLRERIEAHSIHLRDSRAVWSADRLDAILTETATADAERDRLARIGELVENLVAQATLDNDLSLVLGTGDDCMFAGYSEDVLVEETRIEYTPTLLDALEALNERCG